MQDNSLKVVMAVDLGAQHTGVFLNAHEPGTIGRSEAFVLEMPEDGKKFKYSTKDRTATRHRLRSQKRFKLARRLLVPLVVRKVEEYVRQHPADKDKFQPGALSQALCGLLKRRGYSRLEAEVDLAPLDACPAEIFAEHEKLKGFFTVDADLREQFDGLAQNPAKIKDLNKLLGGIDRKAFADYLKQNYAEQSESHKQYAEALAALKNAVSNLNVQLNSGHKARAEYLKLLGDEINKDTRLTLAVAALGGAERLRCLVGNISNLQLRAERWYFNAPEMAADQNWQPGRLRKTLIRAFKYFHPDGENKARLKQVIHAFEQSTDVVDTLCAMNPESTIPPYEDQNNRRPPTDQTLLLSPQVLDSRYQERWLNWAERLAGADPVLKDGIEQIISKPKFADRRSAVVVMGGTAIAPEKLRGSYLLQRALDRVKPSVDEHRIDLRKLAGQEHKDPAALQELENLLGVDDAAAFMALASDYYREINEAKEGLWTPTAQSVLERSDIHPPRKQKILAILVGNILGGDASRGQRFIDEVWPYKVVGRSTVKSCCESIETLRKKHGGEFNMLYRRARGDLERGLAKKDSELVKCVQRVQLTAQAIADKLGLDERQHGNINNPYSLSQLYTLLETDRDGFTSTCLAVHEENAARMSVGPGGSAICTRLPADAVRPFDGVLRKGIERQAYELAKVSSDLIRSSYQSGSFIDVAVVVEENKFAFTADLATIKNNNFKSKEARSSEEAQEKKWNYTDKVDRIKAASRGICPYTGAALSGQGDLDHILPRATSKKLFGAVFNSEQNLIYASREGNAAKQDRTYHLDDLKDNYLQKVFGTADRSAITTKITETVKSLHQRGVLPYFDLYRDEPGAQDCVRHALFLHSHEEAYTLVEDSLRQLHKTRVNGTQAWLIKQYKVKLQTLLNPWLSQHGASLRFLSCKADAHTTHDLRSELGNINPVMVKTHPQPVASHAIDAMCAFATALTESKVADFAACGDGTVDLTKPDELKGLFPESCDVIWVQSKDSADKQDFGSRNIFKEGILGDDFLPLIRMGTKLYVGFAAPGKDGNGGNAAEVTGKQPLALLELIGPYLKEAKEGAKQVLRVDKAKAFELFNKVATSPCSEEELAAANVLEVLEYFTAKQEIRGRMCDLKGTLKGLDQILDDKAFRINLKLSGSQFKLAGSVVLPAKQAWVQLCSKAEQAGVLKADKDKVDEFMRGISAQRADKRVQRKRSPVRRGCSLPVLASPSGAFRIRRKAYGSGWVYQTSNINAAKYNGLSTDQQGRVDWNEPTMFTELCGANLTPVGGRYTQKTQVTKMNEWRRVLSADDLTVWMAPGSDARRYIKIRLPFESFSAALKAGGVELADAHLWSLLPTIKVANGAAFAKSLSADASDMLGTPRSELFIKQCGTYVTFWYIVNSSNTAMKEAFNRGERDK